MGRVNVRSPLQLGENENFSPAGDLSRRLNRAGGIQDREVVGGFGRGEAVWLMYL